MELSQKFENAAAQLQSIADVQALMLCADQDERSSLEAKQAKQLSELIDSGARSLVELDSFAAVEKWANEYPKLAVGGYLTRLVFDASKQKFIVLEKPDSEEALRYVGKTYTNCGPSGGQTSALAADAAFRRTLSSSYATDFSESQDLFNELHSGLETIVAKGPSQEGMSPAEKAAENSQAINNAAATNKQVQQVIGEKAAVTGATPGVESGVTQAVRADAATKIENNLANQEGKILTRSYDIGRENYNNAVKEEMGLPSATITPVSGAASPAIGAENIEGSQANENAAASQSWVGMVGGLADAAVSGLSGGIGSSLFKKTPSNQVPDTSSIPSPAPSIIFPGIGSGDQ